MATDVQRILPPRLARQAGKLVVPCLISVFVLLGGASRGAVAPRGALEVLGALVLLWCLVDPRLQPMPQRARTALWFAVALALWASFQLVPLPPWAWSALPGRSVIAEGFDIVGAKRPWLPLSVAPLATRDALLHLLPPVAIFTLAVKLEQRTAMKRILWTIPLLAAASVALGVFQVVDGRDSPAYLYAFTNWGSPVGLFANINHQASFLLMALPFLGALAGRRRADWKAGDRDYGEAVAIATLVLALVSGVLIAGSFAGYAMLAPVLAASYLIFWSGRRTLKLDWRILLGALGVFALAAANVAVTPIFSELGVQITSNDNLARGGIFRTALPALRDFALTGSGLGSFETMFPLYEDPSAVTNTFINHAHNDYLELVLELGVVGAAIVLAFLVWCARLIGRAQRVRDGRDARLKRAASVALCVAFLHSFLDYPLRTDAIASLAALCLAIIVSERSGRRRDAAVAQNGNAAPLHVEI